MTFLAQQNEITICTSSAIFHGENMVDFDVSWISTDFTEMATLFYKPFPGTAINVAAFSFAHRHHHLKRIESVRVSCYFSG